MNNQKIEKYVPFVDGLLDVHSVFHTIQGEGPFCGTPAVFVRLAGCNLQCPSCDTDYTSNRKMMSVVQICNDIQYFAKDGLVVLTGGEPFRQHIAPLINTLVQLGYYVQVETNGTLPAPNSIGWSWRYWERNGSYIVCSPKAGKLNPVTEMAACAFKYVLSCSEGAEADGLPTTCLNHTATPTVARADFRGRPVYLQPADHKDDQQNKKNLQAAITSCMTHGYILQVQVHKIINVE